MPVLTEPVLTGQTVRDLAAFNGDGAPVTTVYLDVDGRTRPRFADVLAEYEGVTRRVPTDAGRSVADDLAAMERHVRSLDRHGGVRGIAMFSCTPKRFWRAIELPVRVTTQVVVNASPAVRQLEEIIDEYERFGVLLADKQRARMFVYELGTLVDRSDALDALVRTGADDRGELYKTRVAHQVDDQVHHHLKHAAALAFEVYQRSSFDRLLIGAPVEVLSELKQVLHPYLQERFEDVVHVPVGAAEDAVRRAAWEVEQRVERRDEAALVARLRDAVGSRSKGVAGLGATLPMLNDRRVERLFVSAGYAAEGWRCGPCGAVAIVGRACPRCGAAMTQVPDVVEEAVQEALRQHARVETCVDNADLDVLGSVGALLRF